MKRGGGGGQAATMITGGAADFNVTLPVLLWQWIIEIETDIGILCEKWNERKKKEKKKVWEGYISAEFTKEQGHVIWNN